MRFPRMTTRRWMVVVAVVAVATAGTAEGIRLWRASGYYRERASWIQEDLERYDLSFEQRWQSFVRPIETNLEESRRAWAHVPPSNPYRQNAEKQWKKSEEELAAYRARLAGLRIRRDARAELLQKYLRAARYPWLPVAPDAPEPK